MTDQDRLQEEIDRLRRENKAQLKRQNSPKPVLKPSWAHKVDQPIQPLSDKQLKMQAQRNLHERDLRKKQIESKEAQERKEKGVLHEDNRKVTTDQFNTKSQDPKEIMRRFLKPQKDNDRRR